MPPYLEVYALTRHRDRETIHRFLDEYTDRAANEDRADEDLMMEPLPSASREAGVDGYDWEPALTLTHTIQRGLDYPRRAFIIYLKPKKVDLISVTLSFTNDDQMVVGLTLEDEGDLPETDERAKSLLDHLAEAYSCHMGLMLSEQPPPSNEAEFREWANHSSAVFFKTFAT